MRTDCGEECQQQKAWDLESWKDRKGSGKWPLSRSIVKPMFKAVSTKSLAVVEARVHGTA